MFLRTIAIMSVAMTCIAQNQSTRQMGGSTSTVLVGPDTTCNSCVLTSAGFTTLWATPTQYIPLETRKDAGPAITMKFVKASAKPLNPKYLPSENYLKVAHSIGLSSAATDEARIDQLIYNLDLKTYDYDLVDSYLYRQALSMKANTRWVWKPLRDKDYNESKEVATWTVRSGMGFVYPKLYDKIVPERILNEVAKIMECENDVVFLVSDFEAVKPDPFLAISTKKLLESGKIFIIDTWAEPGFTDSEEPKI